MPRSIQNQKDHLLNDLMETGDHLDKAMACFDRGRISFSRALKRMRDLYVENRELRDEMKGLEKRMDELHLKYARDKHEKKQ